MARRVGIREAKAKLSHYVEMARRGEDVVLTDRGTPVVRLVAISSAKPSEEDVLRELSELGLVDAAQKPLSVARPIRAATSVSISSLVREMRK